MACVPGNSKEAIAAITNNKVYENQEVVKMSLAKVLTSGWQVSSYKAGESHTPVLDVLSSGWQVSSYKEGESHAPVLEAVGNVWNPKNIYA